jgi:hypothetical protein
VTKGEHELREPGGSGLVKLLVGAPGSALFFADDCEREVLLR